MSSYNDLFARNMRAYPSLYGEPVDLAVEMLGSSGNFAWKNGELMQTYDLSKEKENGDAMDYSDLDERLADLQGWDENRRNSVPDLYQSRLIAIEAERIRRDFVERHMVVLAQGDCTDSFFKHDYTRSRTVLELLHGQGNCGEGARFLYFPDTITPEWGKRGRQFHHWLEMSMNSVHGLNGVSMSTEHWPEKAQELKEKLDMATARLHPLLHNGETLAEHHEKMVAMTQRLMAKFKAEDEATPSKRSPRP